MVKCVFGFPYSVEKNSSLKKLFIHIYHLRVSAKLPSSDIDQQKETEHEFIPVVVVEVVEMEKKVEG